MVIVGEKRFVLVTSRMILPILSHAQIRTYLGRKKRKRENKRRKNLKKYYFIFLLICHYSFDTKLILFVRDTEEVGVY